MTSKIIVMAAAGITTVAGCALGSATADAAKPVYSTLVSSSAVALSVPSNSENNFFPDSDNRSWIADAQNQILQPLDVPVTAVSHGDGTNSVQASSKANSGPSVTQPTVSPNNAGTVTFNSNASAIIPTTRNGTHLNGLASFAGSAWTYKFTADGDGALTIKSHTSGLARADGADILSELADAGQWQAILLDGNGAFLAAQTLSEAFYFGGATQDHTVDFDLAAGETYTIQIRNREDSIGPRFNAATGKLFDIHDYTLVDDAHFDWSIVDPNTGGGGSTAVPEPASWALMLGGFGLVGSAMRASKRKSAVSFG